MCETLNTLQAPVFIERVSVSDIAHIRKAKKAIRKALEIQRDQKGYAFVEILSPCPTNLKMDPVKNVEFINEVMEKEYPLGNLRNVSSEAEAIVRKESIYEKSALDNIFQLGKEEKESSAESGYEGEVQIKIAGFGGQGVLSLGLAVARAGVSAGRHVSWYPSYGPEQRGGTSNCAVILSSEEIGSPVIQEIDILVAFNRPSLEKFAGDVKKDGLILYERTIGEFTSPPAVKILAVPAQEIAQKAGSAKALNTVMLGVMMAVGNMALGENDFSKALAETFAGKSHLLELNRTILKKGAAWGHKNV
jgi:2-oxoisovalerate ferredoxin oxidoreductase beta subunit